jgi:RNA polymerase sigma-70 factor (ECF subfamily)
VIALNHAVAVAMGGGLEDGLRRIDDLGRTGTLDQYYLFHVARAEILRRLDRNYRAAAAYREAARLATNPVKVSFLQRRLQELSRS